MPKISKSDKSSGRSKTLNFVSPKKNQGKKLVKRKRKKSLKIAGISLPTFQAVVTGSIDPLSLPPSVQGPLRGTLVITLGQVDWRLPVNPPDGLAIRLRWWGEPCHKTLYPPILHEGQILQSTNLASICSVNYAIKSGPKQFKTYLVDTGSLMLDAIEERGKNNKIVGQGSLVNVESLLERDYITDIVPLYDNTRRHIANLRIKAKLTMIGVVQKEPHFDDQFDMIPSALQDGFPIPNLRKPKPTKQLRIPTPDPDLILSPVREQSFEESPIPIKPHKPRLYKRTEFEDVKTLVNTTEKDPAFESDNSLSLLIEKGESLRKNMVESLLESQEKLNQYQQLFPNSVTNRHTNYNGNAYASQHSTNLTEIDTVIGLLLPEDPTQTAGGEQVLPGEYNQFLEESLVRDPALIENILYCDNITADRNQLLELPFDDPFDDPLILESGIFQEQTASVPEEIPTQDKHTPFQTNKILPHKTSAISPQRESSAHSYESIRDRLGIDKITELGRVYAARVQIGKLIFNSPLETLNAPITTPTQISRIYRCTYIVEYQLDQQETSDIRKRTTRRPEENVRVITRKVDGEGNIIFNHRTVVPLCLTGGMIRKWWNSKIEFKIYKKNLGQKKAIYLGVASIPLRDLLESENLDLNASLEVCVPSHLQKEQHPTQLEASIELTGEAAHFTKQAKEYKESTKKDELNSPVAPIKVNKEKHVTFTEPSPSRVEEEYPSTDEESNSYESENSPAHTHPGNAILLHLLLLVSDGAEISISRKECPWRGVNPYLVAKIFCADPSPHSTVHWENASPNFAFRQLFPVQLTQEVLSARLCNKVAVVEVWHKETNRNRVRDELIGLVQLSLHQFYISFTHPENTTQSLQGQYPIISENGCYPITDPLTGKNRGFISALLALGSLEQISNLEDNITEGNFNFKTTDKMQNKCKEAGVTAPLFLSQEGSFPVSASDHVFSEDSEHVFEICIDGAKDVHPLGSGVWGETDCYVSYKFPVSTRGDQDPAQYTTDDQAELTTFSTPTTLSLPSPNFSAHHTHRLYLRRGTSLQQILLDSTYQGMRREESNVERMSWRPQIEFELWRRYYYPDTQNHLLARGYLPTAKVCEMVTLVQHEGSFTVRTFTIPLHLVENEQSLTTHYTDNTNCGQLDLTVRYKLVKLDPEYNPSDPTAVTSRNHPQVFIKLQIKQATGLKDALELAAKSNTNISRYELETGCNTYVMVRLSFSKKTHTTKAIAATFSPNFLYEIEIPLSLSQSVIDNHSPISLAETLSKSTITFQIWHVPMPEDISPRNKPHSNMPHVIIAECTLPFEMLILKSTGIRGWYSLKPPNGKGSKCVGALEVTVEFSSIEEREKVMYEANKFGYQIERPVKFDALQLETETNLEIDINIRRLWLAKVSQQQNKNLCYLRYRFYDKQTTFSPTFSVRKCEGNRFVYDLDYKKSCQVFPSSALEWYLQEERFEVQIWLTNTKSNVPVTKPNIEDFLIGNAYVNLFEMCGFREYQEPQLSGVFPLFRPAVNSLGGSCLEIEISMHPPTEMEMLERSLHNKSILTQTQSPGGDINEDTVQSQVPIGIPVLISIDTAAHLTSLSESIGFLQVTVHSDSLLFRTEKIEVSMSPVWNCQQEVHIEEDIFSPMVGLEVKLWYSASIDAAHPQLMGAAKVDLSPLKYGLPELAGWYNIANVMSSCQGQIKVRATPRERLNIPSSVRVQEQKLEWKRRELCCLIDNPVRFHNPIVIQDVEVDMSGVPDASVTGSFLMRRLKSSLADLEHVQANLKQNLNQMSNPPEVVPDVAFNPSDFDELNDPTLLTMSRVYRLLDKHVESECTHTGELFNKHFLTEQIESEITDPSLLNLERVEQVSDDGQTEVEIFLPQDIPDSPSLSEQFDSETNDGNESIINRDEIQEIVREDEFHYTYPLEENTPSLEDINGEVPIQPTLFEDVNTQAFTEPEILNCNGSEVVSIASTEEPYLQESTSLRNLSPNIFETEEIHIQRDSTDPGNNTHHIINTFSNDFEGNNEVCYSPKSLTDVSIISDILETEENEKSEDILKWVDDLTNNTYIQPPLVSYREERPRRILELEPDDTIKMNIPEDMQVPNFFMPPDTLIQNMRSLRMNALNKFPQEGVKEKSPPPQPKKPSVHLTTPLLPWEANRINKIFLGKV